MSEGLPMWMIAVPLIGLTVVIITHIFIMARWSGKVDANLTQIMMQPAQWTSDLNAVAAALRLEQTSVRIELKSSLDAAAEEIRRLRDGRHDADGKIQRHDGMLAEIGRRLDIYKEKA